MAYSDRLMFEGGASRVGATIPRNLMGFLDAFKAARSRLPMRRGSWPAAI